MVNSRLLDLIPQAQLPPHSDNKNVVSQIRRYNRWLADSGLVLHQPDLTSYHDLLLETLAPASARVHLSSIRRSYRALVENPQHHAPLWITCNSNTQQPISPPSKRWRTNWNCG